jgi:predicted phosphodiesterase
MSSLRLGILSDLHRTTNPQEWHEFHNEYDFNGHLRRIERALAWFEQEQVEALALCGDLTHGSDETAMIEVLGECSALEVPVIAVSGNHDVAHDDDMLIRGIQRVQGDRILRGDPSGKLVCGIRIAGLQVAPTSGYDRSRLQALPAVQDWGDEPVILISHLPVLSRAAEVAAQGMCHPGDVLDREQAAMPLRDRSAPTIVLSGHIHVRDAHAEGPVLQLVQAAMIEPPWEAAVLDAHIDVDGVVLVTRRTHRTSEQRVEYEPTLVDPVGCWRFENGSWTALQPEEAACSGDSPAVRRTAVARTV